MNTSSMIDKQLVFSKEESIMDFVEFVKGKQSAAPQEKEIVKSHAGKLDENEIGQKDSRVLVESILSYAGVTL